MAGYWVYVQNVGPTDQDSAGMRRRHKQLWKAVGPYKVSRSNASTVTIVRDGIIEVINRDKISRGKAPQLRGDPEKENPDEDDSSSMVPAETVEQTPDIMDADDKNITHSSSEDEEEHVLESVVGFDKTSNLIKCRWYGYDPEDDTWQDPKDVPFGKVVAYLRKTRKKIPKDLKSICRPC